MIKDSFAQIGVTVNIEPILFSQQWDAAKTDPAKAQDMFLLLYWPTYSDAGSDNMWSMFYGTKDSPHLNVTGFNLSYWFDDQYNALLDTAIGETVTDPTTSQAKYNDGCQPAGRPGARDLLYGCQGSLCHPDLYQGLQVQYQLPIHPLLLLSTEHDQVSLHPADPSSRERIPRSRLDPKLPHDRSIFFRQALIHAA